MPDGKYLVRYEDQGAGADGLRVGFRITLGPCSGRRIVLDLNSRIARKALEARSGDWLAWMEFEGDAKARDVEHARSQGPDGQFLVRMKEGRITSILDPNETWEQIERLVKEYSGRKPASASAATAGGRIPATAIKADEIPKWPGGATAPGHARELVELAMLHRMPLWLRVGPNHVDHDALVPTKWEDGLLVLKKPRGRKAFYVAMDEIEAIEVATSIDGSGDRPAGLDAFVNALHTSRFANLREAAASLLETSPGEGGTWPIAMALAKDASPKVRSLMADNCRSWTVRVRKTVSKVSFSMLESDPAVFRILADLVVDPEMEVRQKACYALGDHPGTPAGALLKERSRSDPAEEVRKAARHAGERLDNFEKVRRDYERALEAKAAQGP